MVGKNNRELSPADDVAGMAAQRMEFHKAPFTVFRIHLKVTQTSTDAETTPKPMQTPGRYLPCT